MRTESPFIDVTGRRIREHDSIEVKYGYRYTVLGDDSSGAWTAVDPSGHHRIALERVVAFCTLVDRAVPGAR